MKKIISISLSIAILLTLSSCADKNTDEPENGTIKTDQPIQSTTTNDLEPEEDISEIKKYLEDNYNGITIDGSTSMMPLHQSLENVFASGNEIWHNRTVDAFGLFITGENDILLGVDYSDDLLEDAKNSGIELVKKEITREAFAFLINKNNPVQSLTIEQIKDIYSGKITNWSEVGGDDAPINAFQRNSDSGSQIRMTKFMGDIPLLEKDVSYYHGMGDIVEAIANYDEGKYSIAYNMYTFTEKQYTNSDVALLKVNGVQLNDETIFNDEYPIVIYNYIYYNKHNALASEFAENLYVYLMSDEGQKLISNSGYVNLNENYKRNTNIDAPYDFEANGDTFFDFSNKERTEFYDVGGDGNLLVFTSYSDYILRNSKYIDNIKVREFIDGIVDSEIPIYSRTIRFNEEDGIIYIDPWWDASFDPEDFFNIKYNDRYYHRIEYLIDDEKFILTAASQELINLYSEYTDAFSEYMANCELDLITEITLEELKNVYFREQKFTAMINGEVVTSYSYKEEGLQFILEYYKPFE